MSRTPENVGEWHVALEADSLEGLFAEAARVIADSSATEPTGGTRWERIAVTARDLPTLLVDWANELVGRSEATDCAYREVRDLTVERTIDGPVEARGEVCAQPVAVWGSPVKAATYHDASVERRDGRWCATVLFDV